MTSPIFDPDDRPADARRPGLRASEQAFLDRARREALEAEDPEARRRRVDGRRRIARALDRADAATVDLVDALEHATATAPPAPPPRAGRGGSDHADRTSQQVLATTSAIARALIRWVGRHDVPDPATAGGALPELLDIRTSLAPWVPSGDLLTLPPGLYMLDGPSNVDTVAPLVYPELADGSRVFGGRNKAGADERLEGSARRTDGRSAWGGAKHDGARDHLPDGISPHGGAQATGRRRRHGSTRGRNPGDWWDIPTRPYPEAHFAVFPDRLVERPIKATVPEQVCRACGTPRERIRERRGGPQGSHVLEQGSYAAEARTKPQIQSGGELAARYREHGYPEYVTTGWTDCGCGEGFEPGLVLDTVLGSGTTAVMARRLGRRAWGVELNGEYVALAASRFAQETLPLEGASDG